MPFALGCWQPWDSLLSASESHGERQIDKDYPPYASLNGCHKSLCLHTGSVCSPVKIRPPRTPQQGAWVDAYVCLYQQPLISVQFGCRVPAACSRRCPQLCLFSAGGTAWLRGTVGRVLVAEACPGSPLYHSSSVWGTTAVDGGHGTSWVAAGASDGRWLPWPWGDP